MKKTSCLCPECGHQLIISTSNRLSPIRPQLFKQKQTMESTANPFKTDIQSPPGDFYKMTPIAKLEPVDVFTSLLDAGASFFLVSIGGEIIGYAVGWPLIVGPSIGFTVALFRYFGGMAAANKLLSVVEEWSTTDTDKPSETKPERHSIRVEVKENNNQWKFADLPGEQAALQKLAVSINNNNDFLAGHFTERNARKAGLTQDQFRALRDTFLENGWAEWKHPNRKQQGVALTWGGRAILREMANTPPLKVWG